MIRLEKIDLKISGNLELIPLYQKNKIPYSREENDGYVTLQLPRNGYPVYRILNRTSAFFLNLMNGKNKISDIINCACLRYGDKNRDSIVEDLEKLLANFWQLNLIIFIKGRRPVLNEFEKAGVEGTTVRLAFDRDFSEILEFLKHIDKNECFTYFNPLYPTFAAEVLRLRQSFFEMNSLHVILENTAKQIEGIISYGTTASSIYVANSVAMVDYIVCPTCHLQEFVSTSSQILKKAALIPITKSRIYITDSDANRYDSMLVSCGYKYITTLEHEFQEKNLLMYDIKI